ncbi:MAG TPA: efflux RND transporter permease subunit [Cyclobacteriaceae bacterium]|nr:efflux RND transporter permease subunit [Cyclobacteriaceae bacterium]
MFKTIINRPVLATVISILLVIAGIVGFLQLPVTRFPDIAPPSVSVSVSYPGGNAETVAKSVLLPLEEAINGVENMTYMRSIANNSGSGTISVFFKPGTDPDIAAVNVQNSISRAVNQIPPEVNEAGISVVKRQSGNIMTINIFAEEEDSPYDETFIQAYARINVIRELLRVEGVAQAALLVGRDYSMRIWLNPEKLALYGLVPQDVMAQIRDQNFESAPGRFGETSEEVFEAVIKHKGRFSDPEEYENIVIKANTDGSILYLRDIARVEFGASNVGSDNKVNGRPAVTINISQTNNSNAKEIDENIRQVLERTSRFFPAGISYNISYSVRNQIDESMEQVLHTIIEAFVLVFIVVFVFLQNFRSTIIPAIAIPVSLIGTFFFLNMLGFSINILTMFALVLSIGIVVDDAIVVVEAVHHKMSHDKLSPKKATIAAMNEISGAIISITIVMAAVFVPVGFMEGPVGLFYRQFAYTLAIAILISAVNALTLSPVLCALLMKPEKEDKKDSNWFQGFQRRFFRGFNAAFAAFTNKYIRAVKWLLRRKWMAVGALAALLALTYFLFQSTPKAFIPTEDDNFLTYSLAMPPGASLHRTTQALQKADSILQNHEAVASVNSVSGYNVIDAANSPSFGMGYINLKEIKERGAVQNMEDLMEDLKTKLATITEGNINVFARPTVQGFGDFDGLELVLQDRLGGSYGDFSQVADEFLAELNRRPEIEDAFTSFKANFPQYEVTIDYLKAKSMGVSVREMMRTIQSYFGRVQSGDFNRFGRQYRVYVQSDVEYRDEPKSLASIFVKNDKGEMLPVNTLMTIERVYGPEIVNRYNLFNSLTINATPAAGRSTGDAMAAIEEVAAEKLPANYSYEWTGMSLEQSQSGGQTAMIFMLSIILVYFLLAAQYESYFLPLAVLLSIPCGILGVFVAINLFGINNNIYVQVGLVMLIGLLAKNAILIVEFAVQKRDAGLSIYDAAVEAARLRLRPIIMTSFAFIAGLIPLTMTVGSSAQGNQSVSIGAAGGMLMGVVLGIFIIPVLYILFQALHEKVSRRMATDEEENL